MQATALYGTRDVRFEDRPDPTIVEPTDVLIRLPFTCICGSDLWPYRGIQAVSSPAPMGHEYCGFVEEGRSGRASQPTWTKGRAERTLTKSRHSAGPKWMAQNGRWLSERPKCSRPLRRPLIESSTITTARRAASTRAQRQLSRVPVTRR